MKLPQILAQQAVPVPARTGGYADLAGADYSATAQGISDVGRTIARGLTAYSEAVQKAEAARIKQEVDSEAALLKAKAEMDVANFANELHSVTADPDDYQKQWLAGVEKIRSESLRNVKRPETSAAMAQDWPGIQQRALAKMLTRKNELVVEGMKGNLTTTLDVLKQLGGFEQFTPDGQANAATYLATGLKAIEGAVPIIGADAAAKLRIGYRDSFLGERGERQALEDPTGFQADATTNPLYREMSPDKRNELMVRAASAAKTQRAEAAKALDDAMKTWRESVRRETAVHVANRTLTREWLEDNKYAFSDTELGAYHKSLDAQTYGGPKGDPGVMSNLRIEMYDLNTRPGDGKPTPQQVRDRLLFARKNNLVSDDFFSTGMGHLDGEINRREGRGDALRKEGETRIREFETRDYQETKDAIQRAFRTTGGLVKDLDLASEEATAQFLEYIQRHSTYTGRGDRLASDLYREQLPRFIARVDERALARLSAIRDRLGIKQTTDLKPSQLKAMERTMPQEEWLEKVRLYEEMVRIEAEQVRLRGLRGGGATPGQPPGGQPSGGGNPRERR